MSEGDISVKGLLIKYKENGQYYYMRKDGAGNIIGAPDKIGALLFTPVQATKFINLMQKNGFPFQCAPEAVR